MISSQQKHNISCRYCNMRQYQNPAVTMRNRLATWTEQFVVAVGCFSSNYVSFSARVLHLLTFSLWPEPFPVFFIIKYLSIVTTATRFVIYNVCSQMLGPVFFYENPWDKQGNVTFGTSIKNLLDGPGFR